MVLGIILESVSRREVCFSFFTSYLPSPSLPLSLSLQVLTQVHKLFEAIVNDKVWSEDFLLYSTVLRTLAKIVPHVDPVFRDECKSDKNCITVIILVA